MIKSHCRTTRLSRLIFCGLLPLLLCFACGRDQQKLNVLLISIDSLRPDHLGCYGYGKETSPAMDGLASKGAVFLNAVSTTSWTLPAHVSLFTSLYNSGHRVHQNTDRIDGERIMLAEIFQAHGYRTAGFVSGPFMHPAFEFDQGFDEYVYCTDYAGVPPQTGDRPINLRTQEASHGDISSPKVNSRVLPWLDKNKDQPFFLFVHYFDVHYDYIPPAPYDTLFNPGYEGPVDGVNFIHNDDINAGLPEEDLAQILALYNGEIRFTDDHVEAVIDKLKALNLFDNTLIVITSDHGDEFFEHDDKGHFKTLYDESIRIPLIMHCTGRIPPGTRVSDQVRIIDIMPTILDFCGLPQSPEKMGASFLPLLRGEAMDFPGQNLAELYVKDHALISLRTADWKVIYNIETRDVHLYRLKEDPGERYPVRLEPGSPDYEKARRLFRLGETVTSFGKSLPVQEGGKKRALDPETLQRLKTLGYVE
jgi:arylsulfatase A-like enzyme